MKRKLLKAFRETRRYPLCPKVGRDWTYHLNRDFLLVGKSGAQGKVLIRPCSLRLTRLSQSETVGDPARRAHDRSQPQDAHATPACAGARVAWGCCRHHYRTPQTPGGMKLAER